MPITDNVHPAAIAPYAGQVTLSSSRQETQTKTLNSGSDDAEFGLGLVYANADRTEVKVPDAVFTVDAFAGVVRRPMGSIAATNAADAAFRAADSPDVDLVREVASIAVVTSEAVTAGGAVFLEQSGLNAGKFRSDATGATAITNARYTVGVAAAGIAQIELTVLP